MEFIKSIRLDGLLSFAPGTPAIELKPLNVLIGPNGSGKSNLLEALELLHSTPTGFAQAIRDGGGVREWLWKGDGQVYEATIDVVLNNAELPSPLRYRLEFGASGFRTEVTDEAIEYAHANSSGAEDGQFLYRFNRGDPSIIMKNQDDSTVARALKRTSLVPDESILSQVKDPELYPELNWLGNNFVRLQAFREWCFGRYSSLRQPQPANLPAGMLLPDSRNLAQLLNRLDHSGAATELNRLIRLFLPRYERFTTAIVDGTVQLYLHEAGLRTPVPATRLSDGTIRFLAMLALLLSPEPPPVLCVEEPELGLHPDSMSFLAELFVKASQRMQLVITTHSDAFVSALSDDVESVIVCENIRGTILERLDPDKLAFWLDKYRLGDLWRIGELGGNP